MIYESKPETLYFRIKLPYCNFDIEIKVYSNKDNDEKI